jgi:predicted signal transduction protein with EAL and GGDEF domain
MRRLVHHGRRLAPTTARSAPSPSDGPTCAAEFFTIAASPRFRASQRGRMRDSARQALALAAVVALLDCLWLIPLHPDAARLIVAINASVAGAAAIGSIALVTVGRRRPEVLIFALLAVEDAAIVSLGFSYSSLGLVALVYLLLLPTIVALLIPWATRIHLAWLGLHGIALLAYASFAPSGAMPGRPENGLIGVIGLLALISGVSHLGHVNSLRARVQSFVQIQRIRALNRAARRDQVRLDRLNRVLAETARTDELTGLHNRLSMKLDLAAIRSRIARRDEQYGLLMLDFDRFKEINDRLGHVAGDDVLRVVARSLAGDVRPEDAV